MSKPEQHEILRTPEDMKAKQKGIDRKLDSLDLKSSLTSASEWEQSVPYENSPDPAKQLNFYKKTMKTVTADHNDRYRKVDNVWGYDYGMKELYEGRFGKRGLFVMVPPSAVRMSKYGSQVDASNLHALLDEYSKLGKLDRRFDQYSFGVGMSGEVVMFDLNGEQIRQISIVGSYRVGEKKEIEANPYYQALKDFGMTMESYWRNLGK